MKILKVFSIMCLLSLLACATAQPTGDNIQAATAHYKIGISYLNEGKAQQAFVQFQKAYELNPNDKEVLQAIGYIYLVHFDDNAKAIDFFDRATKVDPNYSEAYNNLGVAYEKLGQFDKAIIFYKKALSNLLYPTPEKAYASMGNSYYRLGKYEDALAAYKNTANRAPELSLPYMRMALCYNAMGRYGDASTAMTYAIKLHPVYKGNREKALEDFTNSQLKATGPEEKDFRDYIDILKY